MTKNNKQEEVMPVGQNYLEFYEVLNSVKLEVYKANYSTKLLAETLDNYKAYYIERYGLDDWLLNEEAYLSKMRKQK